MPASQALNETRLPRAVLRRSAAIEARIAERATEAEAGSAAETPPGTPSANAATTVDPNTPHTPPVDPRESDPAYWKQRFNVTQGLLRLEREGRTASEQEFNQRLTELQDQIRTLQASAPATAEDLDVSQFLTPAQVEALGEDEAKTVVATAVAAARDTARKIVEAELKPQREQQAASRAGADRDRQTEFMDKLVELVPDFEEVDKSDGWNFWLSQEDENTGVQRQLLLNHHVGRKDAVKAAAMFAAYAKVAQPPEPPVAPNGNGAVPPSMPGQQAVLRSLTDAEIKDYYKRASLGKVKEPERIEFEARRKLPRR